MKLIFLNSWHGNTGENFIQFIREHGPSADLFLFQEANDRVESVCRKILSTHGVIKAKREYCDVLIEQMTMYIRHIQVGSSHVLFRENLAMGLGLYTEIIVGDAHLHVLNFHGAPFPGDKLDNEDRILASKGIIDFMSQKVGPKIIGGDFNLLPETKSINMFTDSGYTNQINEHAIRTTRNQLAWNQYPGEPKQYFADYVFTSPDVLVQEFSVPQNDASDHLPLILSIII